MSRAGPIPIRSHPERLRATRPQRPQRRRSSIVPTKPPLLHPGKGSTTPPLLSIQPPPLQEKVLILLHQEQEMA